MTIQELLETHAWDIEFNTKGLGVNTIVCRCGDRYGLTESYRAHLAEVLETHQQESEAEVWDEGAWHGYTNAPLDYKKNPYRAGQVRDGL